MQIDVTKAAEDAIRTDGWPHFLARYDGESRYAGDYTYWRSN